MNSARDFNVTATKLTQTDFDEEYSYDPGIAVAEVIQSGKVTIETLIYEIICLKDQLKWARQKLSETDISGSDGDE